MSALEAQRSRSYIAYIPEMAAANTSVSERMETERRKRAVLFEEGTGGSTQSTQTEMAGDPDMIFFNRAIQLLTDTIEWQIKQIKSLPSQDGDHARWRANDSRTMMDLTRSLERVFALENKRHKSRLGSKSHDYDAIKAGLVRRLDKLLAAAAADGDSSKPEPR